MTEKALSRLAAAISPGCVLACLPVTEGGPLTDEEGAAMARAVPARRAEFAAGRTAARQALSRLGLGDATIPMGADRAPRWPPGIVGSISHGAGLAVALVARSGDMLALGIDIEPDIPLPEDVIDTVLGPDEQGAREQARAIFCAKEATYKALYPLSGQVWEFGDIGIRLDPYRNGFTADLRRVAGPIAAGAMLRGHLIAEDGLCIAAMILPRA